MDQLWYSGKFWSAIAVVLTILAGIFLLLLSMERRLARLEKDQDIDITTK